MAERLQDTSKTRGMAQRTSAQANAQGRRQPITGLPHSDTNFLDVSITEAVQHGNYFICDVEVLSEGASAGMTVGEVRCTGFVAIGDRAMMAQTIEGWRIIPIAATSASGGTITNNNTYIFGSTFGSE